MSDNKTETTVNTEENKKTDEKGKKNKNFLVIYSTALFLFAALLIGLSYLSQARVAEDTNRKLDQLSEKTEVATGFQTRLEQVSAKNDELVKTNATLTAENEDLKKQLEAVQGAEKKAEATEYIWKIVKSYNSKSKKDCRKLIEELNQKDLRSALSTDALSELVRIESELN